MSLDSSEGCWASDCRGLARQTPMVLETPATVSYLSFLECVQIGHLQVVKSLDSRTQLWACKANGTMETGALNHFQTIHTPSPISRNYQDDQ